MEAIQHIHHISAIVGNPEENIAFYRDILNLKLIKKTVNFDDPGTYHLYFSNNNVDNGTILTFFNWPNEHVGRTGNGQVGTIAFRIPKGTLEVWKRHLMDQNITVTVTTLFGQSTLQFNDVHGLSLALVEDDQASTNRDIIGFHGVTMLTENPQATLATLVEDMGLEQIGEDASYIHLATVGDWRHHVMIKKEGPANRVRFGVGVVHHIAWSVPDNKAHSAWQAKMIGKGYHVTEVKDRNYFKAIYMRERGGIIFEFATVGPGFTIDEPFDKLGEQLMFPPQYEDRKEALLQQLPPIRI
ncbi:VOC family protein [Staphylococcus gallinarum]|uniref:VOC family protein n=1 Tax=Staphylococcus gallinarum TaxID=1293 RepID=UPI001E3DCD4D|nr:VOC family protein [Staphylococcus gallinarum]MCD8899967.1 VOC family protein [Staphylococcus gallinarum]MCD8903462.1 VOC family protein [Staphylococcus gallinarum]MCD8910884.1 VOC family protein [Staphylococcus gallinarum]MCD8920279.1 VOC family protein [Staphylococcus gallinarum]MEB6238146.1 VOC family protein [Staphylococcus gallinarum]